MRLTLESTDVVSSIDGKPARVWKGRTEAGAECLVFVARIAVDERQDAREFEEELLRMPDPLELSTAAVLTAFYHRQLI